MSGSIAPSMNRRECARPYGRAFVWIVLLGAFSCSSYLLANWLTSLRSDIGSVAFVWERQIPFLPWSVVPYWSIDLLYVLSPFLAISVRELDRHALRLVTAQLIAVICFLLFPLQFTFERPATAGVPGILFDWLGAFDKPFNQAPSLHIALLVILWSFYSRHTPLRARLLLHLWFASIGVSVLTTYQHHFIDVPTGAMLGAFCLWFWPDDHSSPLCKFTLSFPRRRFALLYGFGALGMAAVAGFACGQSIAWLVLWWPALSLALVSWNYAAAGAEGFQKRADGKHNPAAAFLFAPYTVAAFVNAKCWTRKDNQPVHVAKNVFIGPLFSFRQMGLSHNRFALIDLCAELPFLRRKEQDGSIRYFGVPRLDLVVVSDKTLTAIAEGISLAERDGPVLVVCALGYSRSAAAVLTWLLRSGCVQDMDEALTILRRARPRVVLTEGQLQAVSLAAARRDEA